MSQEYRMGAVEGWVVTHDGETLKTGFKNDGEAMKWLHNRHGYSVDHAVRHEGYDIVLVEEGQVKYSFRREMSGPEEGPLGEKARKALLGLAPQAWWDAMTSLYRMVQAEKLKEWLVKELKPWPVRAKVISMLAWNDHNSDYFLEKDLILRTRKFKDGEPVSAEAVADSLISMIESGAL